jgi:hypothetical protein
MGLRIGAGFRLSRHVWVGATVPLGHARRCLTHQGHGSGNPVVGLIGLVVIYALIRGAIGAG